MSSLPLMSASHTDTQVFKIKLQPQPTRTEEGIIAGGVMDTYCLTGALKTAFIQEGPAWGSGIAAKALGKCMLEASCDERQVGGGALC